MKYQSYLRKFALDSPTSNTDFYIISLKPFKGWAITSTSLSFLKDASDQ